MKNIDDRVIEYIMPTRIVDKFLCENVENLFIEKPLQIGLNEPVTTTLKPKGYVILDFGKELCGGVRILTFLANDGDARLRLGESVSESCSQIGEKGSTNDHSLRDITTKLVNYSDMRFMQSGFRFVRIDNIGEHDITLKSVYAASEYRDIPYKGEFECSDELINKIYNTARYTVHLCMQNMLWDGVKRDRLVWIGDTHPEMLAIKCIWGEDKCVEQALDFARAQAPLPMYMNNFPTYSLWWILILKDYYMQNGNIDFLTSNKEYLVGLIKNLDSIVDNDGVDHLPFYFLDWSAHEKPDEQAGVRALFIYAIKAAKQLLNALNEDDSVANQLLKKLQLINFDVKTFKQAKAMQVLAESVPAKDAYEFLTDGNAKGMRAFMSYYILSAVAKGGEFSNALTMLKDYYGGMLEKGATTFWEDFNIDWIDGSGKIDEKPLKNQKDIHGDYGDYCYKGFRHSLCHGWSGGVAPFLTEYVLGVNILEPACKKIKITPNLGNLTYAKGKYPTPYGDITISHKIVNGALETKISAPKEIEIIK